ncbi:hybrid sensor histidine kinase/response regulator transcription factor [Pedobacter sp. L105]|uniref:hybrid sensor histidine kinase/response regulator transcription factor n=1 Tax=Pedobacter sp. L105 TaxID=1641871 RepID=UPI00131E1875|nr:hybrid sensor histidine kinase/response regulator transcription factor [Pedobacter sp. L105]
MMVWFKWIAIFSAVFLLSTVCSQAVFSQSFPYKFKYLTVDEGLSHTDANDIAQDSRGYIWTGTNFGLNRFDGYVNTKYYNNKQPLKNAYQNRIRFVYPDFEGKIWLGTEDGLAYFDPALEQYVEITEAIKNTSPYFKKIVKPGNNLLYGLQRGLLKVYRVDKTVLNPIKINIPADVHFSDMVTDAKGRVYLSSNRGIWVMDTKMKISRLLINGKSNQNLNTIFLDNSHHILTASADTLYLTSGNQDQLSIEKRFVHHDIRDIQNMAQKGKSDYWINTGRRLIRLDQNLNFIQTLESTSSLFSINSTSINTILIDRSECLWLSTFGGGLNYCDLNEKRFYTLKPDPEHINSVSGNYVRSVFAEGEELWIGTMTKGLIHYNLKTKQWTFFNSDHSPLKLKNDAVTAIVADKSKNLWIGTGGGLEILKPNRSVLWNPPGAQHFPKYGIETLAVDCYGNIWFGNHVDKFGVIYKDSKGVYQVKYYGEGYFIQADQNRPQLFVSSTKGLKQILVDAEGSILKTTTYRATGKKNALSSDYTYPIARQQNDTYWVGTIGGGLNKLTFGKDNRLQHIKAFGSNFGVFNDVESLEIDDDGNIWMGGNGLESLNSKTGKLTRFDKNDGLQGNSFKVGSSYKAKDGCLFFGGINGLNYFYPREIRSNSVDAKPILTGILINNQKPDFGVARSAKDNTISKAIGYSGDIAINYLQNNFVISFSSMHFANPLKCHYRYQLIGFDNNWRYTDGNNPRAAYSNLNYDRYTFVVQATNNDGVWSMESARTTISISPPWWKSDLAKLLYAVFFIAAISATFLLQARWYRMKSEIALRQVNEKRMQDMHRQREELSEQQLVFFTNISHDFRTPLTILMGSIENLIGQNQNPTVDHSYQFILRNARRLLNLVTELMNFRKIADKTIKLQVQPVWIDQFCLDVVQEFEILADRKQITFKINQPAEQHTAVQPLYIDVEVIEKILFNLLSNAFKYTKAGGEVILDVVDDISNFTPRFKKGIEFLHPLRAKSYIYFILSDSGIGISPEWISKVFDRYYRVNHQHLGSGVGLAIVKSLAELHKGDIYLYSEPEKGTQIVIGIPSEADFYEASERIMPNQSLEKQLEKIDSFSIELVSEEETISGEEDVKSKKTILLVDDNDDLRHYLKQIFKTQYLILEANNGKTALNVASQYLPDLIISDVMMPDMDGIEFCENVKETFETSHIPFIILSGKDELETKIKGMASGADFYFSKPFSNELLLLTVQNIFEKAEKVKERYIKNYLAQATDLVHSEKDKKFIAELLSLVEQNIKDPNLDVDFLCNQLFISRTKLYQKIKSISNQSVGEFIRTIRLKKAVQIMTHEDVPLYEVAERTGFLSSSNFSRAFKKEFGKSPLQYITAFKKQ